MTSPRAGLLLVNLGTPEAPTTAAVRRYLREFLSDRRVIDLPAPARFLLLRAIILPFRSPKSAEAYRAIWTDDGSPLMVHSMALLERVRDRLPEIPVELAMRYGRPSIAAGVESLRAAGVDSLVVFPLYPQRADSTTGSTEAAVHATLKDLGWRPATTFVPPFFDHPGLIRAFAEATRQEIESFDPDHVLFSFHGLPERHVRRADPSGTHCLSTADCCVPLRDANRDCYRAQCFATAAAIAEALDLDADRQSVAFQSRLGRTPWIGPYTDVTVTERATRGDRRLLVVCPAFVADCLETLEEIGLRARDSFRAAGGEDLRLVPGLNARPAWVDTVCDIATEHLDRAR